MGSKVVVSGAAERVAAVSAALSDAGAEVTSVDDLAKLEAVLNQRLEHFHHLLPARSLCRLGFDIVAPGAE